MTKILKIDECSECIYAMHNEECIKVDFVLIDDYPTIPEWCPLEEAEEGDKDD